MIFLLPDERLLDDPLSPPASAGVTVEVAVPTVLWTVLLLVWMDETVAPLEVTTTVVRKSCTEEDTTGVRMTVDRVMDEGFSVEVVPLLMTTMLEGVDVTVDRRELVVGVGVVAVVSSSLEVVVVSLSVVA